MNLVRKIKEIVDRVKQSLDIIEKELTLMCSV